MNENKPNKPRVLVMDDDPYLLRLMRRWLTDGYDVFCGEPDENLEGLLRDARPELVILDVHMPGTDGFSLCQKIRSRPEFSKVPVIFLTGSREAEDFVKNLQVGGDAYLTKPIEPKYLHDKINEVLASR